jgi:hypothetical protein
MSSKWLEKQQELEKDEAAAQGITVEELKENRENGTSFRANTWKPGEYHTWKGKSDSLFNVAASMHVPLDRLMEYNEIETYSELEEGVPIYYPVAGKGNARKIEVEVLTQKMEMHVSKVGGTKKWAFGDMYTWNDAKPTGFYPEKTNVTILAIAHVPITDKEDPEAKAAYYLDGLSLGDYDKTGLLRYTVGYAWSDLEKGHVETVKVKRSEATPQLAKAPAPAVTPKVAIKAEDPTTEVPTVTDSKKPWLEGFDEEFIEKRLADTIKFGNSHHFVETYQRLDPAIPCMAIIPDDAGEIDPESGRKFIWVRDFGVKRKNKRLYQHQEIDIAATFEYDGILYGRPTKAVEGFNFFGIPMDMLQKQSDVYNEDVDASTRASEGGTLTWSERSIWIPLSELLARHKPEFMRNIKNKKINKG